MAISNTKRILVIQFFVIITLLFLKIPAASALSFNFSSFSSNRENMTYQRAYPQNQVILLASGNGMFGRATYYKPLRLWDNATENLTDFTTHFSFIIDSENRSAYGDGLTFFLAPQVSMIPVNATRGGSFGLANDDERLNSTSNPFFAVEFDIYHNHYDPPSIREHVGIDINSLKSVKTVAWWSDVMGGRRNEAWINYNSSTKNLSVEFTGFRNGTIVKQHLDYKVDLRLYLPEFVTFGFSGATGNATATHTVNSWEFSSSLEDGNSTNPPVSPNLVDGRKSKTGLAVGLGIVGGVLVAGLVLVRLACFGRKRDGKDEEETMDNEFERGTGPKKFSYEELASATDNFNDENKLGQGGFGGVYRGFMKDTNSYIAVKKVSKESKQGIKEYASEVKIISRLRHRNLVQLLGWCHEKKNLLLVYEFMRNSSLDCHLFKGKSLLTWEMRYKIAQDLASGLLYLQEEWEQCVLHRDIKSSNIMLDSNFNSKLGDFGLATFVDHAKGSHATGLAGTRGYMAPECLKTKKTSKASDVFSFGVVALEIACGRRSIEHKYEEDQVSLVPWVWESYRNERLPDIADKKLCMNFDVKQMECLLIVGLLCAHPDRNQRPSIRQVIQFLNFELALPNLPPNMPASNYDHMLCTAAAVGSSHAPSQSLTILR
ncbi:L-type lectin-domain containing receptor kinase IX.1-like isoform X1 [Pistacia vera]|uniref:L-type lectin-domain containing receptor kinase IX.1-like isoform X1 n=1 Tax=Pistacia vera TaxID=55513 RepID=UPI0012639DC9|nr:L-type lectin-domain containing receptor kinase IX.1-like isoform X1 [Pistacia vera]